MSRGSLLLGGAEVESELREEKEAGLEGVDVEDGVGLEGVEAEVGLRLVGGIFAGVR